MTESSIPFNALIFPNYNTILYQNDQKYIFNCIYNIEYKSATYLDFQGLC